MKVNPVSVLQKGIRISQNKTKHERAMFLYEAMQGKVAAEILEKLPQDIVLSPRKETIINDTRLARVLKKAIHAK